MDIRAQAREMGGLSEGTRRKVLNELIEDAFVCDGGLRAVRLDYNAKLFTELRSLGLWPPRR